MSQEPARPLESLDHMFILHGLKAGLAGVLALFVAEALRLQYPEWSVFTVLALMMVHYYPGSIALKSLFRFVGTLVGASLGVWLMSDYFSSPVLFLGGTFLVMSFASYKLGHLSSRMSPQLHYRKATPWLLTPWLCIGLLIFCRIGHRATGAIDDAFFGLDSAILQKSYADYLAIVQKLGDSADDASFLGIEGEVCVVARVHFQSTRSRLASFASKSAKRVLTRSNSAFSQSRSWTQNAICVRPFP